VSINPALVLGPPVIEDASGESIGIMTKIVGGQSFPITFNLAVGICDLRVCMPC
jgi:hypothetical protein